MDRKKNRLTVEAVYSEADTPKTVKVGRAVRGAIEELAGFLGAEAIDYGDVLPKGWKLG
jgi:uncharacterized protein YcaQ